MWRHGVGREDGHGGINLRAVLGQYGRPSAGHTEDPAAQHDARPLGEDGRLGVVADEHDVTGGGAEREEEDLIRSGRH